MREGRGKESDGGREEERRGREAGRKEIRQRKTERCKRAQKLRLRTDVIMVMQHNIITRLLLGLGIENLGQNSFGKKYFQDSVQECLFFLWMEQSKMICDISINISYFKLLYYRFC